MSVVSARQEYLHTDERVPDTALLVVPGAQVGAITVISSVTKKLDKLNTTLEKLIKEEKQSAKKTSRETARRRPTVKHADSNARNPLGLNKGSAPKPSGKGMSAVEGGIIGGITAKFLPKVLPAIGAVGKFIAKRAPWVAAGVGGYEVYSDIKAGKKVGLVGAISAGAGAGAIAGAPFAGVGAIPGAAIGGILGGVGAITYNAREKIAKGAISFHNFNVGLINKYNSFIKSGTNIVSSAGRNILQTITSTLSSVSASFDKMKTNVSTWFSEKSDSIKSWLKSITDGMLEGKNFLGSPARIAQEWATKFRQWLATYGAPTSDRSSIMGGNLPSIPSPLDQERAAGYTNPYENNRLRRQMQRNNRVSAQSELPRSSSPLDTGRQSQGASSRPKQLDTSREPAQAPGSFGAPKWAGSFPKVGNTFTPQGDQNARLGGSRQDMMKGVYQAFRSAGYSHQGALSLSAEVGRENSFNRNLIFGSHSDPENRQQNSGIFSWQKERNTAFIEYMRKEGMIDENGRIKQTQASLNAQARFARQEMESRQYGGGAINRYLEQQNVDPESAARMLGKNYIKWRIDDPRYSADGNNNRRSSYRQVEEAARGLEKGNGSWTFPDRTGMPNARTMPEGSLGKVGQVSMGPNKEFSGVVTPADKWLWERYNTNVPWFRTGDQPAAAKYGMTPQEYVIRGMDPRMRMAIYEQGKKYEEETGRKFTFTSGFRDDYRQSLIQGNGVKAPVGYSYHGGSATLGGNQGPMGAFGKGSAFDTTPHFASWVKQQGPNSGLSWPQIPNDPVHVSAAWTREGAKGGPWTQEQHAAFNKRYEEWMKGAIAQQEAASRRPIADPLSAAPYANGSPIGNNIRPYAGAISKIEANNDNKPRTLSNYIGAIRKPESEQRPNMISGAPTLPQSMREEQAEKPASPFGTVPSALSSPEPQATPKAKPEAESSPAPAIPRSLEKEPEKPEPEKRSDAGSNSSSSDAGNARASLDSIPMYSPDPKLNVMAMSDNA